MLKTNNSPNISWSFEQIAAGVILCAIVFFNCWTFLPWPIDEGLYHSDLGFHLSILKALDETVRSGGNPLDFWYDESPFGFALFRSYQNLPYLITYGFYRIIPGLQSLDTTLRVSLLLLAAFFPISIWWTARRLNFSPLNSAFAAVCASLISESGNFGLGLHNYTFGTGGMWTQAWAVVVLGPALACSVNFILLGQRFLSAVFLIFLCFGSHVLSAFILFAALATFCLTLLIFRSYGDYITVIKRSILLGAATLAATAYQWLFVLLDGRYIHQSIIEPPYKYASHGLSWVTEKFLLGELIDAGRAPYLSCLMVFGLICAAGSLVQVSSNRSRTPSTQVNPWQLIPGWIALSFLVSLSLLIGWEVWGPIFSNLPVLRSLHMHRFIIAVNFFGALLVAYGLAVIRTYLPMRASIQCLALLLITMVFSPALTERTAKHRTAHGWQATASHAFRSDQDLQNVITTLKDLPRTVVHPGMHQTWVDQFKIGDLAPLYMVLLGKGFPVMGGMLFHAFSLAGDTMFAFNPQRPALYDLFGVGAVIAPREFPLPSFLKTHKELGKYRILTHEVTRLSFVEVGFSVSGKRTDEAKFMQRWVASSLVEKMFVGEIDQRISGLQNLSYTDPLPNPTQSALPDVKKIEDSKVSRDHVAATVESDRDTYIMLKTGFHPGWHATVDNQVVQTRWVTPGFVAIAVPKGKHSVEFSYRGSSLKVLLFLGSIGVFCIAGARLFKFNQDAKRPNYSKPAPNELLTVI